MGLSGVSKRQISKLCKDIDERVNAFLDRPIDSEWPSLWFDAIYLEVRDGGRIVSVAAIIAVAVTTEGRREIVGLGIGPSEAEPFWSSFIKGLVKRGLRGVKLVISDAHDGLRLAITRVLGATWQRCRVHWMRNARAHVQKGQHTMVAAAIRQAFLQTDAEAARQTWRHDVGLYRATTRCSFTFARAADYTLASSGGTTVNIPANLWNCIRVLWYGSPGQATCRASAIFVYV